MLWEAGGDILTPDNTHAAFNSDAGVKALTVLQQMAVTDKSLYLDTTNENGPEADEQRQGRDAGHRAVGSELS